MCFTIHLRDDPKLSMFLKQSWKVFLLLAKNSSTKGRSPKTYDAVGLAMLKRYCRMIFLLFPFILRPWGWNSRNVGLWTAYFKCHERRQCGVMCKGWEREKAKGLYRIVMLNLHQVFGNLCCRCESLQALACRSCYYGCSKSSFKTRGLVGESEVARWLALLCP